MSSYYEKILATGEVKCIDEEVPFEIPQGWEWCRLRDLCTVFGRIGFRGYTRNDIVEKGFGAITLSPSNMQDNGYMNYSVVSYISWKKYEESPEIKVKANDVLIVKTGSSYGKTCIISDLPEKATINPQIAVLKYSFVNNQWLTYFLNAPFAQEQFRKYVIGTSIPTFSQEKLSSTLLPLPPKNEQEHLIKKLSLLGKCIGSYNVIQQLIDRLNVGIYDKLKKSILQEAIQGKLVPQTAEEGTAKELLEQIKAEKQKLVKEGKLKKSSLKDSVIFRGDDNKYWEKNGISVACIDDEIPFEIPSTWIWCRLGDCVKIIGGYAFKSYELKSPVGYRVIRISDISENGLVNKNIVKYSGNENLDQYLIKENDILIAMTGGTVGKSLLLNNALNEPLLLNQRVAIIRNFWINVEYLNTFLHSPYIKQIIDKKKNSTNDNISMSDLNDFLLPLPPLKEQHRIVEKFKNVTSIMSR